MKIVGGSLLVIVVLAAAVYSWFPSVREHAADLFSDIKNPGVVPQKAAPWPFYGRVIDQDGKPVEGESQRGHS